MLRLDDVRVRFAAVEALAGVALDVREAEIMAVLGPSGSGKSTLLRVVAGLQPVDRGVVELDGRDISGVEPHRRDMAMMFQDHALFPHRDVGANVGFGLRMRGVGPRRRGDRVTEVLELVGLAGYADRAVATLSGGESQRVALARALAPRPRLLLLDEPLGSLDRPLRDRLVGELRGLLGGLGIAVIHVTHDHDEAFAVADRVAVMDAGRVCRVGTPAAVWRDPRSALVARFLGHQNLVTVGPRGAVPWGELRFEPGPVVLRVDAFTVAGAAPPGPPDGDVCGTVTGLVSASRFRSGRHELRLRTEPAGVELAIEVDRECAPGERMTLEIHQAGVARLSS